MHERVRCSPLGEKLAAGLMRGSVAAGTRRDTQQRRPRCSKRGLTGSLEKVAQGQGLVHFSASWFCQHFRFWPKTCT